MKDFEQEIAFVFPPDFMAEMEDVGIDNCGAWLETCDIQSMGERMAEIMDRKISQLREMKAKMNNRLGALLVD